MKLTLRIVGWTLGGLIGLLIVALVAIDLYSRTAGFHDYLRGRLTAFFDSSYKGQLRVGSVAGSLSGGMTLHEVTLSYDGQPVLTISRVYLDYALLPLLRREIDLTHIAITHPLLDLRQQADGQWNLLAALTERHPSPPSTFSVMIPDLLLREAVVRVTDRTGGRYSLEQGQMGAGIAVPAAGGVKLDIRYLEGAVAAPRLPPSRISATLAYQNVSAPPSLTVREIELRTRQSLLRLRGIAANLEQEQVDFTLALIRLGPEDLAQFVSTVHPNAPLTGELRLTGVPANLILSGQLAAAGAHLNARVKGDVSAKPPTFTADMRFAGFDAAAMLARPDLSARISGQGHLTGNVTELASLAGTADLTVNDLGWHGYRAGDLHLTGALRNRTVTYSGRVSGPAGVIDAQGNLNLAGARSYQAQAQFKNFQPQRLNPALNAPAGDLNLTATVKGQGFDLASATASGTIQGQRSRVGAVMISGGRIDGDLSRGWLTAHAALRALESSIGLDGRVRLAGGIAGSLDYRLAAPDLAPWMNLVGRRGTGAVKLAGSASGTPADFKTRGSLNLSQAGYNSMRAGSAEIGYQLAGGRAQWLRTGQIVLTASDVAAGPQFRTVSGQVRLRGRARALQADLQVAAQDARGHNSALGAEVDYSSGRISGRIGRLELGLPDGTWRLARPALVDYDRRRLEVRELALSNGASRLAAGGVVTVAGAQDFELSAEGLRLDDLKELVGSHLPIEGVISLEGRIGGTAAAPQVAANLNVSRLQASGIHYAGLRARLAYAADRAELSAVLAQDASRSLEAQGTVPIAIGWSHGWKMESVGDADIRVFSTGLSMAFVSGLAPATLRQVSGTLVVDLTLRGPLAALRPQGSIELRAMNFLAVPVNVKVADLTAIAQLNADRITLTSVRAHAGRDGMMTASGNLTLRSMVPQEMALELRLAKWPAIHTNEYQADVDANVRAAGPLQHLSLNGSIEVLQADLRPNLRFLNAGATKVDRTIVVIRPNQPQPQPRAGRAWSSLLWHNMAIALNIAIHRNSWIREDKSVVEIRGDLRVDKAPGHDVTLAGRIDSVRGVIQVVNQSFTLSRAQLVFTGGGRINPSLDILAQRQLPSYIVQAIIRGTAEKPTLTLQSQPELPQSEILSLLMFGSPVGSLTGSQQQSLQQQALSMATGFAAGQLAESVASALGLQGFGAGGAGVGGYVAPGLFISAGQDTNGITQGGRAALDYNLTKHQDIRTSTSTVNGNQIELRWQKNY
jgi:autotransporter translocation and assembly factor TamB